MHHNEQPTRKSGNDTLYWLIILGLAWLAWPTLSQGRITAQPAPTIMQSIVIATPLPELVEGGCDAAVHSVPPGWAEGLGGTEPSCWGRWSEAQRLEFLNWVREKARK